MSDRKGVNGLNDYYARELVSALRRIAKALEGIRDNTTPVEVIFDETTDDQIEGQMEIEA